MVFSVEVNVTPETETSQVTGRPKAGDSTTGTTSTPESDSEENTTPGPKFYTESPTTISGTGTASEAEDLDPNATHPRGPALVHPQPLLQIHNPALDMEVRLPSQLYAQELPCPRQTGGNLTNSEIPGLGHGVEVKMPFFIYFPPEGDVPWQREKVPA